MKSRDQPRKAALQININSAPRGAECNSESEIEDGQKKKLRLCPPEGGVQLAAARAGKADLGSGTGCGEDTVQDAVLEETLIAAAQAGDHHAFGRLLSCFRRKIFAISGRYFAPGADRDDLNQEATIGFFKAVRDFRTDRGDFGAFVELCVQRQVVSFVRGATRMKHGALNQATSLDSLHSAYQYKPALLRTQFADEASVYSGSADLLNALWDRCSELERGVLLLFCAGFSISEMPGELGLYWKSIKNAVWRLRVKARKLVREI